jgi:hypothetical protein
MPACISCAGRCCLQLLDDRAGPSVRDDERQRIVMARTNVNEVDVEPVDFGHEVRQGVQLGLAPAPVVVGRPIAREFGDHRQGHALRIIGDGLLVGPAGSRDARTQRLEFRVGDPGDRERPDRCRARRVVDRDRHADLLGSSGLDLRYRLTVAHRPAPRAGHAPWPPTLAFYPGRTLACDRAQKAVARSSPGSRGQGTDGRDPSATWRRFGAPYRQSSRTKRKGLGDRS